MVPYLLPFPMFVMMKQAHVIIYFFNTVQNQFSSSTVYNLNISEIRLNPHSSLVFDLEERTTGQVLLSRSCNTLMHPILSAYSGQ